MVRRNETLSRLRNTLRARQSGLARMSWSVVLLLIAIHVTSSSSWAALPTRLVLLLDGVSYRDMKALQEGTSGKTNGGRPTQRHGFHDGYFPVSRLISTFPSISDPAWTDILGNRPTAGYQRTYFNSAERSEVSLNGLTSAVEYERQMTGPTDSGFRRAMGYLFPRQAFNHELDALFENFLENRGGVTNYYALIHSTDVAQHLSGDILRMLCVLDERLEELRAFYREREGKELEILILSDHGNNHAGTGKRVGIRSFLKKAGYRITKSTREPKDVVLPTAGIESWVEIHNSPSETDTLVQLLSQLEGVDVITAQAPNQTNRFMIVNSKRERAVIDWNAEKNSFRYSTVTGDPIGYLPVVESLAKQNKSDSDGFASADIWMEATLDHRYPLALERIARGHTGTTLNGASILISLKNDYVHCEWLTRRGVVLVRSGGTHGGLDEICSTGILLSNFSPTHDTSTHRVAALYDGFKGLRDYRSENTGAKWVLEKPENVRTFAQEPKQRLLQLWTPSFSHLNLQTPIDVIIEKAGPLLPAQIPRIDLKFVKATRWFLTLNRPLSFPERGGIGLNERTYALPLNVVLAPRANYRIIARIRGDELKTGFFNFAFRTDERGGPLAE